MVDLDKSYVLLTAARNEEKYIGDCIDSILAQSVLPIKWIIVNDGSTDGTEKIVESYEKNHTFIRLVNKKPDGCIKGFSSKVYALNMGFELVQNLQFSFIGHLDADITLGSQYYEKMLEILASDSALGITGGYVYEPDNGIFKKRPTNSPLSVAGGVQLFRKNCYKDIGGLKPLAAGGEDSLGEIQARMKGWKVLAFPEFQVFHHKASKKKRGAIKEALRGGVRDYLIGNHIVFEIFKCARRIQEKPYFIIAILQMYAFLIQYLNNKRRQVSKDLIVFIRKEQINRIKSLYLKKRNI